MSGRIHESITDTGWGITQNAARSNITGPNGSSLPTTSWRNAWLDNFPDIIAERLKVRPPSPSRDIPAEDIKRLEHRAFGDPTSNPGSNTTTTKPADPEDGNGDPDNRRDKNKTGSSRKHPHSPLPEPEGRILRRQSDYATPHPAGRAMNDQFNRFLVI